MKDASMSLGIYFEIKDAELYGGEGTTGQLEAMASMAKVPKEKVRIISKGEYEENTEEE